MGQDAWAAVHYAAKLGDAGLLQAVMEHPGFVRGLRTGDGKTARVVAMEAGNWRGETKQLLNTFNTIVWWVNHHIPTTCFRNGSQDTYQARASRIA